MCIRRASSSRVPEDREAIVRRAITVTQGGQEALKAGRLKGWGISPDGRKGYVVFGGSETDLARIAFRGVPLFESEIYPIMTANQWMEALKSSA